MYCLCVMLFYWYAWTATNGASGLNFHTSVHLPTFLAYKINECSGESAYARRLALAFIAGTCDKHNKFSFFKGGLALLKTACAPCMLGTLPNLVIVKTALKPRHRRTLTIVIESVGKILFWQKKNTNSYLKAVPSAVHWKTLKTQKMKLIKIYLFLMYQFFEFWQQWTSTRQQNMFLIPCQNNK